MGIGVLYNLPLAIFIVGSLLMLVSLLGSLRGANRQYLLPSAWGLGISLITITFMLSWLPTFLSGLVTLAVLFGLMITGLVLSVAALLLMWRTRRPGRIGFAFGWGAVLAIGASFALERPAISLAWQRVNIALLVVGFMVFLPTDVYIMWVTLRWQRRWRHHHTRQHRT